MAKRSNKLRRDAGPSPAFVASLLALQRLRKLQAQRDLKHCVPVKVARNAVWAMDAGHHAEFG